MSTTKNAYLFGPIAGLDFDEAQDWRGWMRKELQPYGIDAYSPMRGKEYMRRAGILSGHGRDYPDAHAMSSAQAILARDKFDVLRADVLIGNFLGAKRVSIGSMFEMAWAHLHHKPVIVAVEDEDNIPIASSEHLAWLAALIDGEGCISIGRSTRKQCKSPTYQPQLIIKMTNEAMLRAALERTKLGSISGPRHSGLANRKPYWNWTVSNGACTEVLRQVFPWLIVKRQQAALAIEIDGLNKQYVGRNGGLTPEMADAKASVFDRYQRAQRGECVEFSEPGGSASVHSHLFFNSTISVRVHSLEALRDVVITTLA